MIEVKDLVKNYGGCLAVDHISFTVENGRVYGFLGPNGAGKSTTLNIITGCLASTEGTVVINGHDIYEDTEAAQKCIGYLPEIPPLYPDMTPYEYLKFVSEIKGIAKEEREKQIEDVMEKTQITHMKNRLIKQLSKGYRQRVGIAQAILGYPEVIILDEPTVGLDPKQIIEIRDLIKRLGQDHTVILSSHILGEVSAICDYVLIISKGKLVASDTLENLSAGMMGRVQLDVQTKGTEEKVRAAMDAVIAGHEGVTYECVQDGDMVSLKVSYDSGTDLREQVSMELAKAGCPVFGMTTEEMSLEDIFLQLTGSEAETDETEAEDDETEEDESDDEADDAEEEEEDE